MGARAAARCGERLPGQPIFYPVLTEDYATRIARDWNTKDPASGFVGYVLRFDVYERFAAKYEPRRVGGAGIEELWVPAGDLELLNSNILGRIEKVSEHPEGACDAGQLVRTRERSTFVSAGASPEPICGLS